MRSDAQQYQLPPPPPHDEANAANVRIYRIGYISERESLTRAGRLLTCPSKDAESSAMANALPGNQRD
uniref:Uncharacterized protein n=1 Tax=Trichogramma kaykai TaxID=54128 RepID=A0ABD2XKM9_9HYME